MGGRENLDGLIARDKPIVILGNLPDATFTSEVIVKAIFPVVDPAQVTSEDLLDMPDMITAMEGSYVSLTSGGAWPAGETVPPWLGALPNRGLALRLNLVDIVAKYGPFIEMGLGTLSMSAAQAAADTSGQVPTMSMEEAAALADLGRAVIQSLDFFTTSLDVEGQRLSFVSDLGLLPGSPLAPGPQPDFKQARDAAGILPEDWGFISVTALAQTNQMDLWFRYYQATMLKQAAALDPEPAARMQAWFEKYVEAMNLYFQPTASAVRLEGDIMAYHSAMRTEDAAAGLDRFAYLLNHATDAGLGMTATEEAVVEVEGVSVRSWDLAFDYEAMAEGMYPPQGTPSGPRPQMQQMNLIMSRIMPGVKMAAVGDYLLFTSGQDPAVLEDMIKRAKKNKTRKQKPLDAVAKRLGPPAAQVTTGDLGTFMTWLVELLASFEEDDEVDFTWPAEEALNFTQYVTVTGDVYGFGFEMDTDDLRTLWEIAEDLEEED